MNVPSSPSRGQFAGCVAVVTGAASGIGRATAELLLASGAAVHAVDLKETADLTDLGLRGAHVMVCDVTRPAQRRALVDSVGECDFLVNSAGVIRLLPISAAAEDDWDQLFEVNAKAVYFLCQQLGSRLRPDGAIVNVSSIAARNAQNTETGIYAATKAAVLSITRTFAHAFAGRGVRVNAVVPGLIDTPMQDFVLEQIAGIRDTERSALNSQRAADVPLGRLGTAQECAAIVSWLLSPAGAYLTGQAIAVDGGATML